MRPRGISPCQSLPLSRYDITIALPWFFLISVLSYSSICFLASIVDNASSHSPTIDHFVMLGQTHIVELFKKNHRVSKLKDKLKGHTKEENAQTIATVSAWGFMDPFCNILVPIYSRLRSIGIRFFGAFVVSEHGITVIAVMLCSTNLSSCLYHTFLLTLSYALTLLAARETIVVERENFAEEIVQGGRVGTSLQ